MLNKQTNKVDPRSLGSGREANTLEHFFSAMDIFLKLQLTNNSSQI